MPAPAALAYGRHMRPVVALAATLLLAACGAAPKPAATTTTTTHIASAADIGYLSTVRAAIQGSSDADLISLGKQACGWLDGNTLLDVMQHLVDSGISTKGAAAIATAAIPAYCPNHKDKLPTP